MIARTEGMWWGVALESPDPSALAGFYPGLLGWPIVHEEPGTAVVGAPPAGGSFLVFQRASDYVAPRWPPVEGEQRAMAHLDFQVAHLDAAVAEALALGASVATHQANEGVRVMLDPDGHPFCLCLDGD